MFTLIACGLAGAWGLSLFVRPHGATGTSIRTAKAVRSTLKQTLRLTGSTAASAGALLRAPFVRGRRSRGTPSDFQLVLQQMADPGSVVQEGDVVAVFDSINMQIRLDNTRADRQELEYQIASLIPNQRASHEAHEQLIRSAKAAAAGARLDLLTAPVQPQIQVDSFELARREAEAVLRSLEQQRTLFEKSQAAAIRSLQLEAAAERVEEERGVANIERFTVRAPLSGLVVAQEIRRGAEMAEVRAGDQLHSGQPFLRIIKTGKLVLEAAVNQIDAAKLRPGLPVHVRFDAYPEIQAAGRIHSTGPIASSGRRRDYFAEVPVRIDLEESDPTLVPHLTASADVVLASESGVVTIPREAVFQDGDSSYAFVQNDSGFEKRVIELGLANNIDTAVRSGVAEGEIVALEQPFPIIPTSDL